MGNKARDALMYANVADALLSLAALLELAPSGEAVEYARKDAWQALEQLRAQHVMFIPKEHKQIAEDQRDALATASSSVLRIYADFWEHG